MSPWLFNLYKDGMKMGIRRRGESEDCSASCMQRTVLSGMLEEDVGAMVGGFVGV